MPRSALAFAAMFLIGVSGYAQTVPPPVENSPVPAVGGGDDVAHRPAHPAEYGLRAG
jgi:hypothetical protein